MWVPGLWCHASDVFEGSEIVITLRVKCGYSSSNSYGLNHGETRSVRS